MYHWSRVPQSAFNKRMSSYLITGCSRGLGLELASQFASSGEVSTIFAAARKESPALKELIEKSNGRVIFVQIDVTNEASIIKAATEVEKALGGKGLDVLINNAGILDYTPKGTSTLYSPCSNSVWTTRLTYNRKVEDLNKVLATNVTGVHLVTRAFLPLLGKGSLKKIVNMYGIPLSRSTNTC